MADNAVKPSKLLETWPAAVIDPEGTFKYVLIEGKKFSYFIKSEGRRPFEYHSLKQFYKNIL